jgi:hypothetical protein
MYGVVGAVRDVCYNFACMYDFRFSEVHMTLAQLSIMSGRFSDCTAHLNLINFILDPRNGRSVVQASNQSENDTSSSPSELETSQADNSSFIKSRITSLDYRAVTDPCCSPTGTKRVTVKSPKTWTHTVGCSCAFCSDPVLEYLWLSCYVVDALSRLRQGQIADAEKMLMAAHRQTERLVSNAGRYVKDLSLKRQRHSSVVSAERIFQAVYSEIYVRLCELVLIKGKDKSQFSSWYAKALDCIQRNYTTTMVSYLHLTELYYLHSVRGLTWPSAVEKLTDEYQISTVDMLCAGIGRMKTTDNTTPPVKRVGRKCSIEVENLAGSKKDNSDTLSGRCSRKKSTNAVAAPVKKRPVAGRLRAQQAASNVEVAELPRMSAPAMGDCQELTGHFTDSPDIRTDSLLSTSDNLNGRYYVCAS